MFRSWLSSPEALGQPPVYSFFRRNRPGEEPYRPWVQGQCRHACEVRQAHLHDDGAARTEVGRAIGRVNPGGVELILPGLQREAVGSGECS